jgi:hypothetical protein
MREPSALTQCGPCVLTALISAAATLKLNTKTKSQRSFFIIFKGTLLRGRYPLFVIVKGVKGDGLKGTLPIVLGKSSADTN